jgi:hypothetical protein
MPCAQKSDVEARPKAVTTRVARGFEFSIPRYHANARDILESTAIGSHDANVRSTRYNYVCYRTSKENIYEERMKLQGNFLLFLLAGQRRLGDKSPTCQ